jgi:hypothetical protein
MIPEPDVTVITGAAGWLGTGLLAALGRTGNSPATTTNAITSRIWPPSSTSTTWTSTS